MFGAAILDVINFFVERIPNQHFQGYL